MVGMKEIAEAMEYFASLIANYPKYGEGFNYEDVAKEEFALRGRGCVWINLSEFIVPYLKQENRECEFFHKYVPLSSEKNQEASKGDTELDQKITALLEGYEPTSQYVICLSADCEKLPKSLVETLEKRYILVSFILNFYKIPKPSHITEKQIRKRLNRMMTEGIRLLILDTSKPDFMGKNLEKWLREVKNLERQGKYINVMIDSENDNSYQDLPDDLKANILPMHLG
jgi:hypothetical protein